MPKIVDRDQKRANLLSAAMEVFIEKGIAATRIRDIAERANVGKGTIYEYFENKNELILQAFVNANSEIGDAVKTAVAMESNPLKRIRISFQVVADAIGTQSHEFLEITFELWLETMRNEQLEARSQEAFRDLYANYHGYLTHELQLARDAELIVPEADPDTITRMLLAMLDGLHYHSISLGERDMLKIRLLTMVDTMLNLISK